MCSEEWQGISIAMKPTVVRLFDCFTPDELREMHESADRWRAEHPTPEELLKQACRAVIEYAERQKAEHASTKPAPLYAPGDERWIAGRASVPLADAAGFLGRSRDWVRKLGSSYDGLPARLERDGPNYTARSLREYWKNHSRGSRRQ
jgi:hypothetical protein